MQGNLVVVVGQGYVGLPLSIAAVEAGHDVLGIDLDLSRVEAIRERRSPVEDVSEPRLSAAFDSGRFAVASDYAQVSHFACAVLSVPTPLAGAEPDLGFIESAAKSIAPMIERGSTVILESTTYPGTTEELLVPILERGSGLRAGADFHVGYSPERIDPGNVTWNLLNTPKIVSGIDLSSLDAVDSFYSSLGIPTVRVSGTREGELTKLLENTFRHVNIALVNELAMFASSLEVDIWEAIEAAATKPFGFMKFTPGPGVGGHCLPVDPSYLSWAIREKAGADFRFVELANRVNSFMPEYVVSRALELLERRGSSLSGRKVLIAGLAYKAETSDLRESPALAIASMFQSAGLEVFAVDSYVPDRAWPSFITRVDSSVRLDFELGVLVTHHKGRSDTDHLRDCEVVLDTRNVLGWENVVSL